MINKGMTLEEFSKSFYSDETEIEINLPANLIFDLIYHQIKDTNTLIIKD